MELLGSGMVNRKVIEMGGLDPDQWQGFAFGVGVDRLAMLKYGMDDLRAFFDGDVRWLRHYGFSFLDQPTLSAGRGSAGMKFSLAWLKQYLETGASAQEIAAKLNALGIEVEGLEDPAERLAGFRVAKVLTAAPHPNADKLQVLTVDTGDGEPLQVVCGAPNARAGLVGVLGTPGAVVPAGGFELQKSAIRGVESNGMMCSTRELELGDDHEGIIELPADAPVGTAFADYRGHEPGVRRRDHPQPARLHGRLRHRPRPRRGRAWARSGACASSRAGHVRVPDRNPHRRSRRAARRSTAG
jgi:tRNA-binding EMAP/Myf-like protein